MLAAVVNNTIAVLTGVPEEKEEWWQALGQAAAQVRTNGDEALAAFLGVLQRLVEGASFESLAPAVPPAFQEAWAAIQQGVGGGQGD